MGYDAAKHFICEGAIVYVTGRRSDALNAVAQELGEQCIGVVADASVKDDSSHLARIIRSNGHKVDGLFVNAGVAQVRQWQLIDEEFFDRIFNTNVKGAFFTVQAIVPVMKRGGSIVFNGSCSYKTSMTDGLVYAASKAAISSMTKTLTRDLLPLGIRVNTIHPGPISTSIWDADKLELPEEFVEEATREISHKVPLGRMGRADEITGYLEFLFSEKSTFVLGSELVIDGGMTTL